MRRFDSDPRLQYLQLVYSIQGRPFRECCGDFCGDSPHSDHFCGSSPVGIRWELAKSIRILWEESKTTSSIQKLS